MTIANGKPRQGEKSTETDSGRPEQDQGGGDSNMQTHQGNGVAEPAARPTIDNDVRNHLGRKLKASYDELVRQPVPDRFRELLEKLEGLEKKR